MIIGPVAAAVTGRLKPQIYDALEQLQAAGVLVPRSATGRNRSCEANGLLGVRERLEASQPPH